MGLTDNLKSVLSAIVIFSVIAILISILVIVQTSLKTAAGPGQSATFNQTAGTTAFERAENASLAVTTQLVSSGTMVGIMILVAVAVSLLLLLFVVIKKLSSAGSGKGPGRRGGGNVVMMQNE